MAAIESAEGLSNEDEEYHTLLDQYVADSGMDQDAFISYYGMFNVEQTIMMKRISDLIIDNATVSEKVAEAGEASGSAAPETEGSQSPETEESRNPEAEGGQTSEAEGSRPSETAEDGGSAVPETEGSQSPETE